MSVRTQSPYEQLQHLPNHNLFELSRNDSTRPEHKAAAAQLLEERKGSPLTMAENAIAPETGPFAASVTTATMQSVETVDNADPEYLAKDAPANLDAFVECLD